MGHLKVNDQSTPQFINDDGSILEIKNIDQAWKIICDECHDKDSHIGYTYAIPKNISVSFTCEAGCKDVCSAIAQEQDYSCRLAILTHEKPESVPSCEKKNYTYDEMISFATWLTINDLEEDQTKDNWKEKVKQLYTKYLESTH